MLETALTYYNQGQAIALEWLTSPAAWSQFVLILLAYLLAKFISKLLQPRLTNLLTPKTDNIFSGPRLFILPFLALLLPLLAYGFTAAGEQVTRSIFGSGAVIAFGKRLFILLAVRVFVRDILTAPFLKMLGKYFLLPVAILYTLAALPAATTFLETTVVGTGNIQFSLLALIKAIVVGSILFWLGMWFNSRGAEAIRANEDMPVPTRELATKAFELTIFAGCFLLLMNILGLNLSALALLGGAVGVGLGFGLQKIASNFISGIILLLEGQATVGDYVELDGGEAGTIVKMLSRATILETFDGKWIVVPNEDFITTRIVNYSDAGSGNRYEADFSVSYDTDINLVPAIVEQAVDALDFVLTDPYPADCELRGFGDSGINFALEFWVEGIDDGRHKYTSQVLFAIWNALKDAGIEIPYPQRVVHLRDERSS